MRATVQTTARAVERAPVHRSIRSYVWVEFEECVDCRRLPGAKRGTRSADPVAGRRRTRCAAVFHQHAKERYWSFSGVRCGPLPKPTWRGGRRRDRDLVTNADRATTPWISLFKSADNDKVSPVCLPLVGGSAHSCGAGRFSPGVDVIARRTDGEDRPAEHRHRPSTVADPIAKEERTFRRVPSAFLVRSAAVVLGVCSKYRLHWAGVCTGSFGCGH
jgi:hypothetical protein